MKTSIATVSISGSLPKRLEAIAKAGFDGIELFEQDFIAHDSGPREVAQMVRDLGLEIFLFQPFRDFEGLPSPFRERAFDRAERKFDLMQELKTDLVLVCSSVHLAALGGVDRAAADFAELGERAAKRGLRVEYEALAWGRYVNDHRDAWEIVRRADHPGVGLVVDSFHTLGRKLDPASLATVPGDRIFFVQLADAPLIAMDLLYWSRHFRNMPGEGDLAVTDFMKAVMATGYDGPVSLEIFNDQFRGGNSRLIAADGYRSLLATIDDMGGSTSIPSRVHAKRVEFLEFATKGDEAEALTALLRNLGFHRVGTHVSKALTLWQQGDIRVVLNEEATGYANSAWLSHGTTVCDIGLGVGNALDAVARATALGSVPFSQPLGPGEIDIPAIRGLSGSVLHFLDAGTGLDEVRNLEFVASVEDNVPEGAGLTRIDHLAQTMGYDEMLSWSLFYTTVFNMKKAPMVDVIDPDGLIRSQAIEAPDGALRITLNGAETHRTMAGSFLADSFGASVQHIALATDDLLATADRLAALGFQPLKISANYYADVAARFDIAPDLLDRLRAANVLYDEDAQGSFLQLYSYPFAGGIFFEIVERREGYAGYGGPNASFRIAAQKRLMRPKGMPRQ